MSLREVSATEVLTGLLDGGKSLSMDQKMALQNFKQALFDKDICNVRFTGLGHFSLLLDRSIVVLNQFLSPKHFGEPRLSIWIWTLVLVFLGILAVIVQSDRHSAVTVAVMNVHCLWGGVAYLLFLLFSYLYILPISLALTRSMSSFERYTGTFVAAWLFLLVSLFIQGLYTATRRNISIFLILVTTLFAFYVTSSHAFNVETMIAPHPHRAPIQRQVEYFKKHAPHTARVLFIWQQSRGLEFYLARYELYPHRNQDSCDCFSVRATERYGAEDIFTDVISVDKFAEKISTYDYLMIGHADEYFWHDYGSLFPDACRGSGSALFRIEAGDGGLRLIPL